MLDNDVFNQNRKEVILVVPFVANKIEGKINQCIAAACISFAFTMIFHIINIYISGFTVDTLLNYIDPLVLVILAFGVAKKKSRVCAILMFSLFIISKMIQIVWSPNQLNAGSIIFSFYLIFAFWQGISGTFEYHKMMKSKNTANSNSVSTIT